MKPLSATEAISPAIEHTNGLLNPRRDFRFFLKITAIACIAQMGGLNFNFGVPPTSTGGGAGHGHASISHPHLMLVVVVAVILFVFTAILFYIGSRLQFVLFDVILNRQPLIAPAWRRFGRVTWRWIGLKLLLFLGLVVCMLPIFVPFVFYAIHTGQVPTSHAGTSLATLLPLLGIFLLLVLVLGAIFVVFVDFGLPFMALEGTSVGETLRRIAHLVRVEPGQFALYVLMRFLMVMVGAIGCELAVLFATLLLAIPLGGIGFALWLSLRHSSPAGHFLMIAAWVMLGLLLAAFAILAMVASFGYILSFIQAYAIYFLAGRYPLLGETLDPTPGLPFTPPPPFRGPDEPGDDSGPGFPMDPVPA